MYSLTAAEALSLVSRIAAIGVTLSTVELLLRVPSCFRAGVLAETGGFTVLQAPMLGQRVFLCVLSARLLAAISAFVLADSLPMLPVAVLLATSIFLFARNPVGQMAADQINVLTLVGLTAASIGGAAVHTAALWFIAMQVSLSYITAGWHKLRTPHWRNGTAIRDVFNTRTYGDSRLSGFMHRYPSVARVVAWSVVGWECLFPMALLHPAAAVAATVFGVSFHFGTSAVSKLNHFVWAFSAAYPAVLYCAMR
jgi:hypothetical protein